ncbi:sensor histidine kinase [Aurantimonas coralicida]|uniref:sensor histidine kinase n=1 Tax=Aurantimonas coralicida TaxID=182270 RepID=UPI001E426924|nr:PAS domain-containing sensor histidine kinase [Aurantimonas coralicida]MCD1643075.1 PAS domain-containing sensor histidine kinase [Aurantimonas coralicida]
MTEALDERQTGTPAGGALSLIGERLDVLVPNSVSDAGERRVQALAIGGLIGAGLLAAIASPILALLQSGILAVAAPLIVAGMALAAAAYLSSTGAIDHATWLGGTLVAGLIGWGALFAQSSSAAWLILLAILPAELLIAGRRGLAAALAGSTLVFAACLLAVGPPVFTAGLDPASAALILCYGATLVLRLARRSTGSTANATATTSDVAVAGPSIDDAAALLDAALVSLDARGMVTAVSPAALTGIGQERDAVTGRSLVDLVHVGDRVVFLQALADARRTKQVVTAAARLRRGDGTYHPASLRLRGCAETGAVHVAVAVAAHAAGESADLQTALDAANQSSAAKSQFLAAVSHELRTPLNAIIGFSDILDQEFFGGFESDRQKEYVGLIRQSGQHLLSVVNSLLDVSKIEAGRYELVPEAFGLGEAMDLAVDVVREEARRKDLRLDVRPGCRDEEITADRRACHQILLNLLSNALKFTEVGVVTLESRRVGQMVEFSVSDTGIGIAESDIERLGRPFVQVSSGTTRRYQGTGLGLSLVKGLAELHGGDMTIRSQPGVGTMVTVRLPAVYVEGAESTPNLKENVVALSDARTQTNLPPQTLEARRSA